MGLGRTISQSSQGGGGPLQSLTAKRLVIWGLLPSLVCPLQRAIMRDPVVAADGWTYERRAIEKHYVRAGRGMPLSPITGERMTTRHLMPNNVVNKLIKAHMPDLAPLEVGLPMIQLLHVWHVQIILSFLDGVSLARCEQAWSSFLAAAGSSPVWAKLLMLEFSCTAGSASSDGNQFATARGNFAEFKASALRNARQDRQAAVGGGPVSQGLKLIGEPK